jgi:hypothetical protein
VRKRGVSHDLIITLAVRHRLPTDSSDRSEGMNKSPFFLQFQFFDHTRVPSVETLNETS